MLLNILVSVRQWLQFIYLSLVGTEVVVKYSIFLSKMCKGLNLHTQGKKISSTSHPGIENSPRVPYWAWTNGYICLHVSSRHPLWNLREGLQGVQAWCRCCRIVLTEFHWSVSFSATSVSWLLLFCIASRARVWSQVFHQISGLFGFTFLYLSASQTPLLCF